MPEIEQPKRIDPPSRPVDGDINDQAEIRNRDPSRVYCKANPNDYHTGVPAMERLGWIVETHRKDGPKVLGGQRAADGAALTIAGDVVMSRSREAQAAYEASKHGMADLRSTAIGQRGGIDGVRGDNGRLATHAEDAAERFVRG
ncbi:MAG: hypothetical protein F2813_08600 [Actinobacteria bacterium]|uniref:Unannotated protein n=1 Tax=freshwater metagenome TaxID=449393 RepID=A0A6J6A6S9_9ZZZZ|nr:hypothetical protein [Actinomycetota bacterium]